MANNHQQQNALSVQNEAISTTENKDINEGKIFECIDEPIDWNELTTIRTIDGVKNVKRRRIVGRCTCCLHPGKITKSQMETHECIKKQCRHFCKYLHNPYWAARAQKKLSDEKKRAQAKTEQDAKYKLATSATKLREEMQTIADECSAPILITRAAPMDSDKIKVYYVSDNNFYDGHMYPNFFAGVLQSKNKKVYLQRLCSPEGRYITTPEYMRRVAKNGRTTS